MERLYIVTLWRHEDLHDLYQEMEERGIRCENLRPSSRNTYYWMTKEQSEDIASDSRVRNVELHPEKELGVQSVSLGYHPYTITNGQFYKDDISQPSGAQNYRDWGKLFCAGTEAQRDKSVWGSNNAGNEVKTDTVTIFSDGRDVDVVVVDDAASYDCDEWLSPSTGLTRYVQYDWYEELRQYVPSLPSGSYNSNYRSNSSNSNYHATHVMSTIGGQHYGWAREANLYNLAYLNIQSSVDQGEVMDTLRAFHKYKDVNPNTGKRNPTVTNHSYGSFFGNSSPRYTYPNVLTQYISNGTTYTAANPNPSGWNAIGLNNDFDINMRQKNEPYFNTSVTSDIEDAIADGVVLIGAAGNSNYYQVNEDHELYDDRMTFDYNDYANKALQGIEDGFTLYTRRGSSPVANGMICVGAINQTRFNRRADFSHYGPGIDLYAPGTYIMGAFNSSGTADGKYGGNNYYRAISGTSMASPQVCGVAACLASGKERFTQDDMLNYIEQFSHDRGADGTTEMSFNGEHNGGIGEYEREVNNAGTFSSKWWNIVLSPNLGGVGVSTCNTGSYFTTQSGSSDSLYPATTQTGGSSDRFIANLTSETCNPKTPAERVFEFWEGDRIQVKFPPRYCMFDCSASNTTDGWCFGTPVRMPHNPSNNSFLPQPTFYYDRTDRDYANTVTGNPTLNLIVGDILIIDTGSANSSHPFWIKSSLGSGSTGALSGFYILNNGGQGTVSSGTGTWGISSLGNGQIILHTQHLSAGTYYYQCGNHSSMNGEINLMTPATAFGNRRVFFKTARSQDSTSDLVTGTNTGDIINQGAYNWKATTTEDQALIMRWQTRPGDAGTYYLQCESEPWAYQININQIPGAGTFNDLSCNKDGPTRFLAAVNPRVASGSVGPIPTGRRNKSSTRLKYPRKSTVYRAR